MKVTDTYLTALIDKLNNIICEDALPTRKEREDLVRAVAAIGAMKARLSLHSTSTQKAPKQPAEKKERVIDPRFPNAGTRWKDEDVQFLNDVLEPVPVEETGNHVCWLAEKLGRTPYSVACKISTLLTMPENWKDDYRKLSDNMRLSKVVTGEDAELQETQQNGD